MTAPTFTFLKVLVLVFDSTISTRSRVWLVASELEDPFLQVFNVLLSATEAGPAGTRGVLGLVGVRE